MLFAICLICYLIFCPGILHFLQHFRLYLNCGERCFSRGHSCWQRVAGRHWQSAAGVLQGCVIGTVFPCGTAGLIYILLAGNDHNPLSFLLICKLCSSLSALHALNDRVTHSHTRIRTILSWSEVMESLVKVIKRFL